MVYHKVRASLDRDGKTFAWDHHIVAQQLLEGSPFAAFAVRNGIDKTTAEAILDSPSQCRAWRSRCIRCRCCGGDRSVIPIRRRS
jgi:hypothetical protein